MKKRKLDAFDARIERERKNSPVKVYRPGVADIEAVLARGQGNKVNAPKKVAFEVWV